MSIGEILEIAITVLCCITAGLMLYFRTKGDLTAMVSELIAAAEKTGLTGPEKMACVVEGLYKHVPVLFKKIISKQMLQDLAQYIFDRMREYADEYKKKSDSEEN